MAKKNGRPTKYTTELAKTICSRLSEGESLRHICKNNDMPNASTVHLWVLEDLQGFSKQYEKARLLQANHMFEELLEIADNAENDYTSNEDGNKVLNHEHINRSRLRVDTRKWFLSKVAPKLYGDKMDLTSDGKAIKGNTIIFKDFTDATGGE